MPNRIVVIESGSVEAGPQSIRSLRNGEPFWRGKSYGLKQLCSLQLKHGIGDNQSRSHAIEASWRYLLHPHDKQAFLATITRFNIMRDHK